MKRRRQLLMLSFHKTMAVKRSEELFESIVSKALSCNNWEKQKIIKYLRRSSRTLEQVRQLSLASPSLCKSASNDHSRKVIRAAHYGIQRAAIYG
jgi:hypothetical protein